MSKPGKGKAKRPSYAQLEAELATLVARQTREVLVGPSVNGKDVTVGVSDALQLAAERRHLSEQLTHAAQRLAEAEAELARIKTDILFLRGQFAGVVAGIMRRYQVMTLELTAQDLAAPDNAVLTGVETPAGGLLYTLEYREEKAA